MRFTGLLVTVLMQLPLQLFAQEVRLKEDMIKKGREKVPGFVAIYKHPRTITRETLKGIVTTMDIKHIHHKKGFSVSKGAVWQSISPNKGDYYYKVGGKKKKAKVYFIASKGYDNYITSATDAATAANINAFLADLTTKIAAAEKIQELQVELQTIKKPAN